MECDCSNRFSPKWRPDVSQVSPRPGDPVITSALVAEHGLTGEEFERLKNMLGREPTFTELGIISALWSEHCSYKHSRPLLRNLPVAIRPPDAATIVPAAIVIGVLAIAASLGPARRASSADPMSVLRRE